MKFLAALFALLPVVAYAQDPGCHEKTASTEVKEPELVDYALTFKVVKDDCKEALTEALQKRFGGSATLDGNKAVLKIPTNGKILISEILAALGETKVELDESAVTAKGMTVWFDEACESLQAKYPEYNFGEPGDGTTALTFGSNTTLTLSDLRKIGKLRDAQIQVCSPKKGCGGCKEGSGCGGCKSSSEPKKQSSG